MLPYYYRIGLKYIIIMVTKTNHLSKITSRGSSDMESTKCFAHFKCWLLHFKCFILKGCHDTSSIKVEPQQRQAGGRAGHLGQGARSWSEVGFGHPQARTVQLFLYHVLPDSRKAMAGVPGPCSVRTALSTVLCTGEAAALFLLV